MIIHFNICFNKYNYHCNIIIPASPTTLFNCMELLRSDIL